MLEILEFQYRVLGTYQVINSNSIGIVLWHLESGERLRLLVVRVRQVSVLLLLDRHLRLQLRHGFPVETNTKRDTLTQATINDNTGGELPLTGAGSR